MTWNIEQSLANWRGSLPRSIMEKTQPAAKLLVAGMNFCAFAQFLEKDVHDLRLN